jgi:hypothetical protein
MTERIEIVITNTRQCEHCTGGVVESWTDEYDRYCRIECTKCFLGSIVSQKIYKAKLNENGTYEILRK